MTRKAVRRLFVVGAIALILSATTTALQNFCLAQGESTYSEASDLPLSPEAVAREILQLQQELGGSVVENRPALGDWHPSEPHNPLGDKILSLRETAFQLDEAAHRLELQDLYEQADALRNVATRLRHDARELKRAAQPQRPFPIPTTPPGSSLVPPSLPQGNR